MSFDWKGLIGGVAPVLATVATGGNPLAGAAVSVISKAVLGTKDGKPADIQKVLTETLGDPIKMKEIELALQKENHDFQVQLENLGLKYEELDVKREEIAAGDRNSARDMQKIAIQGEDKFVKRFVYWYAIFLTIASFVYFFCVTFIKIDIDQRHYADIILGFLLGSGLGVIIAFFYGTSHGALAKNKQIADLAAKAGK